MSDIKIIALGGVRENAKNMYVVEVDDNIYILDCGLKYPENELLGIDTVIPDFEYLALVRTAPEGGLKSFRCHESSQSCAPSDSRLYRGWSQQRHCSRHPA